MTNLAIDIETYSERDLADCGVYTYASDPSFRILLFAWAFDDEPVTVTDLESGEALPERVLKALNDPSIIKTAFNANFERTCIDKFLGIPVRPDQWQCTMALAGYAGLPMNLAQAAEVLEIEEGKMKAGRALIEYFSKPCKPTKTNGNRTRNLPGHAPEKWATFKEYCGRDVEVERAVRKRLSWVKYPDWEYDLYELDQRIADWGVGVDLFFVDQVNAMCRAQTQDIVDRMRAITKLENPNSAEQLRMWLSANVGRPVLSVAKAAVAELKGQNAPENVQEVLALRSELAKTSLAKYQAILDCVAPDERVHGLLQYYGANRTGRWAGRLVQLQNLPQNKLKDLDLAREVAKEGDREALAQLFGNVPDTLSQLIRTAFVPREGYIFYVADFSAIEARVIAWLSKEMWRMQAFAHGEDIYCASASRMFGVRVVKHGENGHLRQKGKIAELALGYAGGVGALKAFGADKMGLSETEMASIVAQWRTASPGIVTLWRTVEKCAEEALNTPGQHKPLNFRFRDAFRARENERKMNAPEGTYSEWFKGSQYADMICQDEHLLVTLPSGRSLCYQEPLIQDGKISYMGMNQTTRKWEEIETRGGKLVENLVQAIARDCLAWAMLRLRKAGYHICFHVHDEVIIEAPYQEGTLEDITAIMGQPLPWAPGLLLRADGYTCNYYKKD